MTNDTDRGIRAFFWGQDNARILYVQDAGGDENWRLYDTELATGTTRDLTPFENVQAQLIAEEKDFPTELLVGLNKDNPQLHDVYHLDLETGELEMVLKNPGIVGFVADAEMRVRAGLQPRPDGGMNLVGRRPGATAEQWEVFLEVDSDDALGTAPIGFTADGNSLYLLSSVDANASRLLRVDLDSGVANVLAEDPQYDVSGVMSHPDTKEIQMVSFTKARTEHVVLDPTIADDIDAIGPIQPGDITFLGRDHADRTWLVAFTVDDGPVAYYAWDRETKTGDVPVPPPAGPVGLHAGGAWSRSPSPPGTGWRSTATSRSRPGSSAATCRRCSMVHGGPVGPRQLGLQRRGPVAGQPGLRRRVQVNFRGSTGYGKEFVNAGNKQWAAAMHDDLIDAVEHVDRRRAGSTGSGWRSPAAPTAATPPWSAPPSPPTCSAARSTSSARRT